MEATTILDKPVNMYTVDDFNEFSTLNIKDLNKSNAIFVQFPSTPSFNRITRGIFEYMQFIFEYIVLLFLIILILIFVYIKKPFYYYLLTLLIYFLLIFNADLSCL